MLRFCVAQIAALAIVAATLAPNSARADENYKPMRFYVAENTMLGTTWVVASGEITGDTPKEFAKFALTIHGRGMRIVLNSAGGKAVAALELGELIRRHGFNTDVGFTLGFGPGKDFIGTGFCASACAYAFLGGVKRDLLKGSVLGYHDFSIEPELIADGISYDEVARIMSQDIAAYLKRMGIDKKLLEIAAATKPSEIYEPDSDELREMGIISVPTYIGDFETEFDAKRRGAVQSGGWISGDAGPVGALLHAA